MKISLERLKKFPDTVAVKFQCNYGVSVAVSFCEINRKNRKAELQSIVNLCKALEHCIQQEISINEKTKNT